jgi:hypothetical protein
MWSTQTPSSPDRVRALSTASSYSPGFCIPKVFPEFRSFPVVGPLEPAISHFFIGITHWNPATHAKDCPLSLRLKQSSGIAQISLT